MTGGRRLDRIDRLGTGEAVRGARTLGDSKNQPKAVPTTAESTRTSTSARRSSATCSRCLARVSCRCSAGINPPRPSNPSLAIQDTPAQPRQKTRAPRVRPTSARRNVVLLTQLQEVRQRSEALINPWIPKI